MNNNLLGYALNMILSNPRIANQQLAKEFVEIIKTGDTARGVQMAQKLCETYHTSQDKAVQDAMKYFNLRR